METAQATAPPTESPPVTGAAQLAEQVRRVHRLRHSAGAYRTQYDERMAAFVRDNGDLVLALREEEARVEAAELALKSLALTHYKLTQEKKPTPGVEVKVYDVFTVTDEIAALAWAKKSDMCLVPEKVDTKAVLKIAAVTPLPFVKHDTEPKASIATDLEKVLGGAS
jgi:hypothetical protein